MPAEAIETFVVSVLSKPPAELSADAQAACLGLAMIWDLFTPCNRKRALDTLFREIRADLATNEITFVANDAAAELAAVFASA
jgi:hypothetical protein